MSGLVIQANLHHCKPATDLLVQDMLQSRSQVVALVQEPYVNADGIPSGIPRCLDRYLHTSGCRTAIFGKDCSLLLCPKCTSKDIVTCQVTMGSQRELYIVTAYADIKLSHLPKELVCLLEEKGAVILSSLWMPILIALCGDHWHPIQGERRYSLHGFLNLAYWHIEKNDTR